MSQWRFTFGQDVRRRDLWADPERGTDAPLLRGTMMNRGFLKAGHLPTLFAAFLYFDLSFMVWVLLGSLGAEPHPICDRVMR